MAKKKIEWEIALNDTGVKRGVKGVDAELASMQKSFEALNKIKAFTKGAEDLKKLEKKLEAARVKAAQLAKEAETGGKRQQNAYAKAAAQVDKLTVSVRTQTGQLAKQSGELKKVGVSTRDITNEQIKAEKALQSTTAELKAANKIQEFYAKTGVRSYRQVSQEIEAVNRDLKDLQKYGKLGPEELARASSAAEKKVQSLKRELAGVDDAQRKIKGDGIRRLNDGIVAAAGAWLTWEAASKGYQTLVDGETAVFNLSTSLRAANREFGNIGSVESWESTIDRLSDKLKIYSDTALTGAAAKTIDMTKRLGLSSAQMENLIYLTGEASAGKFDLTDAIERTTAAMRGEAESSEALGFTLNEDYVKAWYAARGELQGAWKDLSDLEKAQVRYNVFVEQASPLIGKAGESVNTFSGALNQAKAEISDAITGSDKFAKSVKQIGKVVSENKDTVVGIFEIGADAASLFGNAVNFTVGTVKTLAATANLGAGSIFKLASMSATLTDALGLTDDAASEWRRNSDAAFDSARDLLGQAGTSYANARGEAGKLAEKIEEVSKKTVEGYEYQEMVFDKTSQKWFKTEGERISFKKKSVEIFIEGEKKTAEEAEKTYKKIKDQVYNLQQTIDSLGGLGGDGLQGLQEINGEWQYFATNAEKAKSTMQGFNNTALVGTSQLADDLYDLSLAGRDDLNVWESRRRAAEQYLAVSKSLRSEASQMYAGGDREGGDRKMAESIAMLNKSKEAYKSLSAEVKSEWTPAMEAAHKKAAEGVKNYESEAKKALAAAKEHYDKAKKAGEQLADSQLNMADKLAGIARRQKTAAAEATGDQSTMVEAAKSNYASMVASAKEYEEKSKAALAAGNTDKALDFANRSIAAWDSLGSAVEVAGQKVVTAEQALIDQASGITKAGAAAHAALKAQEKSELEAAKAAEEKAKRAIAAKESEAAKVKALEEEKGKVLITAQEGAQEAAEGMISVNDELRETYQAQRDALQDIADVLDDAYNFSGVKDGADELKETLSTVGEPLAASMTTAADSAVDDVERINAEIAKIQDKTVTITVKEVSASASGSITGVPRAATGNIFTGRSWSNVKQGRMNPGAPSMIDSIPVLTAPGEPIIKASSFAHLGRNLFRPLNRGDEVGVAKQLVRNHPHVLEVFTPQIRVTPAIKVASAPAPARQTSGGGQLPGNLIQITVNDYVDGVSYDKFMTQGSWDLEQAREQRRRNITKVTHR